MVLTTIRLSRPGLAPPVYLAGTFTQWEPTIEMDHDAVFGSRDQHEFSKAVDIEVGEHQFKFRLGHGDWWIVDDGTPTVADGFGNLNNVIQVVEAKEPETKVSEVGEQLASVEEAKPAPIPAEEVKPVQEVSKEIEPASHFAVTEDKPVPEPTSKQVESTPDVPVSQPKPVQEVPIKETKPAQEVVSKEVNPVLEVPATVNELAQKALVDEHKPTQNGFSKEPKPAQDIPVKEDKSPRKVASKESLPSIRTTASDLTAVVNQEISSVQSMLRDSDKESEASPSQEPQTRNQKSQNQSRELDGAANNRAEIDERKPAKVPSKSFIKRLFSCFSGKTVFGMGAMSAVLVAIYMDLREVQLYD